LVTEKPVGLLTGNLNVVREDSEGILLEAVADSAVAVYHAIAYAMMWVIVLKYRRVRYTCFPVVPCVVAWLHSRITLPVAWHWMVCCVLRVI
jgi:hypothetical protein